MYIAQEEKWSVIQMEGPGVVHLGKKHRLVKVIFLGKKGRAVLEDENGNTTWTDCCRYDGDDRWCVKTLSMCAGPRPARTTWNIDDYTRISVRIPYSLVQRAVMLAESRGLTRDELITQLIEDQEEGGNCVDLV
jgi:hypothetical protein